MNAIIHAQSSAELSQEQLYQDPIVYQNFLQSLPLRTLSISKNNLDQCYSGSLEAPTFTISTTSLANNYDAYYLGMWQTAELRRIVYEHPETGEKTLGKWVTKADEKKSKATVARTPLNPFDKDFTRKKKVHQFGMWESNVATTAEIHCDTTVTDESLSSHGYFAALMMPKNEIDEIFVAVFRMTVSGMISNNHTFDSLSKVSSRRIMQNGVPIFSQQSKVGTRVHTTATAGQSGDYTVNYFLFTELAQNSESSAELLQQEHHMKVMSNSLAGIVYNSLESTSKAWLWNPDSTFDSTADIEVVARPAPPVAQAPPAPPVAQAPPAPPVAQAPPVPSLNPVALDMASAVDDVDVDDLV